MQRRRAVEARGWPAPSGGRVRPAALAGMNRWGAVAEIRGRAASPSAEGRPGGRRTRRRPRRRRSPRSARVADASARDGSHRRAYVTGLVVALGVGLPRERCRIDPGCVRERGEAEWTPELALTVARARRRWNRWSPTSGARTLHCGRTRGRRRRDHLGDAQDDVALAAARPAEQGEEAGAAGPGVTARARQSALPNLAAGLPSQAS
jgi:hypothetical protein